MEPYLRRHPYTNTTIAFVSSRYTTSHFSPPLYRHFNFFSKRWSLTSTVTPTPTSPSDSSRPLTYLNIFPQLSTTILTFIQAVEPNLQRHPYNDIRFGFLSSRNPHRIFSQLSTPILTFQEAVEPYLQRHPYANEVQERVMPRPGIADHILLMWPRYIHVSFNFVGMGWIFWYIFLQCIGLQVPILWHPEVTS